MSETTTVTLTDFLLAKIAEDETAARDRQIENVPTDCWDPDRVLVECAAKRALLTEVATWRATGNSTLVLAAERAERHLAAVYADHPDYRPEWRP